MSSTKTSGAPSTALPTTGYYYGHYNNIPFKNEQSLSPDYYYTNREETYEKILLDKSEELYNKIVEDLANKTISDAAILSQSLSPLSLLPRSDDDEEKQQRSHVFQRSTGDANKAYIYREKHTVIQSEIDNDDEDN
jgi:hypothetical protein